MRVIMKAPPGPPPRPGLAWREETSRWYRPEARRSATGVAEEVPSSLPSLIAALSHALEQVGTDHPEAESLREDLKAARSQLAEREGISSTTHFVPAVGYRVPAWDWDMAARTLNFDVQGFASRAFGSNIPGLVAVITEVSPMTAAEGVFVRVDLEDADHRSIGMLQRSIYHDGSELVVHHDLFELSPSAQGRGIAKDLLDHAETEYLKQGVARIELNANLKVGGYAWARQGFDVRSDSELREVKNALKPALERLAASRGLDRGQTLDLWDELVDLDHMWELAEWNPLHDTPGAHLGKQILLGSSWPAVKMLDPQNEGYQVGLAYRRARQEDM